MKKQEQGALQVEYICPDCGKHLAWALPTVMICCPQCGLWVSNKNRSRPEVEIFLPENSEQTVLF
ncbi:MAG: hypothetical protein SO119_08870 [Phascolarctobacterium sp.]|nr:hypothetical protein [Phascolarctobacterium sp.]